MALDHRLVLLYQAVIVLSIRVSMVILWLRQVAKAIERVLKVPRKSSWLSIRVSDKLLVLERLHRHSEEDGSGGSVIPHD